MKLWLLRPREDLPNNDNPFRGYDVTRGFVVRAESEGRARELATSEGGDEVKPTLIGHPDAWRSNRYSLCMELTTDGPEAVIIEDYRAG